MDSGSRTIITPTKPGAAPDETAGSSGGEGRIRCPLCGWEPRAEDRWWCDCGHEWNTFDTGGVCPGCMKQWTMTKCPACGRWSAHSDWYPKG